MLRPLHPIVITIATSIAVLVSSAHAAPEAWVQTAKFTASDQASQQHLGASVAVSADGNTIALGAPGTTSPSAGAVYVYTRAPGTAWSSQVETARLSTSDGSPADQLGAAIAMSADGAVIVAGAPNHLSGNTIGAVYVFVRSGQAWHSGTEVAQLGVASTGGDLYSGFGAALALSRDGLRLIVGAPNTTLTGELPLENAGAAFVFRRPVTGWTATTVPTSRLLPSVSLASDLFGAAVAVSADGTTIVAGAPGRTADNMSGTAGPNPYRGIGYVFDAVNILSIVTTSTATLRASNTTSSDDLGASAAMDAAGDTILLGAPGNRVTSSSPGDPTTAGAGFVFTRPAGGWRGVLFEGAHLAASDGVADDFFGTSAALSADGHIAALGTPGYDDLLPGPDDGVAHIFFRPQGAWVNASENYAVPAQNIVGGEAAGTGIGLSAGAEVLVLGAPLEGFGPNPNVIPNPKNAGAGYALQLGAEVAGPAHLIEYINAPFILTYTARGIPAATLPVLSGTLPNGVTFDTSSGVLSGTPTQAGDFTFTLSSTNDIGYSYSSQLAGTMKVISDIAILGADGPVGVIGQAYSQAFTTNVPNPTWAIASGTLPTGITFDQGAFTGTPVASGIYSVTIRVASGPLSHTRDVVITVDDVLTFTTPALADGFAGAPYAASIATNMTGPVSWVVLTGTLPPGIGLNPITGLLSGLPAQAGDFTFAISAMAGPQTASRSFSLHVNEALIIRDGPLAPVTVNAPLSVTLTTNMNGATTWTMTGGSLPEGVQLDAVNGVLSGLPTRVGNYTFVVQATHPPQTARRTFTLQVQGQRVFAPIVAR